MTEADHNLLLGIVSTIVAILAFGSVFVPVKKFEARDGIFVAFCMSIGQIAPCLITSAAYSAPTVYPIAMLSGVLYSVANSFSVIIMECIGMSVGSLLWNLIGCLWGWAVARFGLFGTTAVPPAHDVLNIIGVVTICFGGVFFALVRCHPIEFRPAPFYPNDEDRIPVFGRPTHYWRRTLGHELFKRLKGVALAIIIGTCYGNMPTPANIMVEMSRGNYTNEWERPPSHQAAYMFSFAIGALFTSSVIFIIYSISRRNKPFINVEIACPAMASGVLNGTAASLLFIAMENLDQVIAYPVIAVSPGIVVSLWSVLVFHEIRDRRNLLVLMAAYIVTVIGVVLIAISKSY